MKKKKTGMKILAFLALIGILASIVAVGILTIFWPENYSESDTYNEEPIKVEIKETLKD